MSSRSSPEVLPSAFSAKLTSSSSRRSPPFWDTDSIAFTNPRGLPTSEFRHGVNAIRRLVRQFGEPPDQLLIEVAHLKIGHGLGVKVDLRRPAIRKASAHGLGHLIPPYRAAESPRTLPAPQVELHELGVERWQYDLWYLVASAAVHDCEPDLSKLPGLDRPAMMSYSISTPTVESWFAGSNRGADYTASLRPFGFIMAPLVSALRRPLGRAETRFKLIAPLDTEPDTWQDLEYIDIYSQTTYSVSTIHFDEHTAQGKTYRQIIGRYLKHPDGRRVDRNGRRCTRDTVGYLSPMHVDAFYVEHTGKEADALGEPDPSANPLPQRFVQLEDSGHDPFHRWVLPVLRTIGPTSLARQTGVSISAIVEILGDRSSPHAKTKAKLTTAAVHHGTRMLQQLGADMPRNQLARLYLAGAVRSAGDDRGVTDRRAHATGG
jgi:hypothetical protein